MNLQIVFKFKDCKLQFYEKRRLFCYFSVNPWMPASRWRRLLKLKRKKKPLLRLSLASFSPHHYSWRQRSPFHLFITHQKLLNALKSPKSKKSLQESTNRASECYSPHSIYNSLLRMCAIQELKMKRLTRIYLAAKTCQPHPLRLLIEVWTSCILQHTPLFLGYLW